MRRTHFLLLLLLSLTGSIQAQLPAEPNVILVIIDDLNDYQYSLSAHPQIETPNLDRLAETGLHFTNAFTTSPGCAPSRTSMLSGKDVNYTQVIDNTDYEINFRNNFSEAQGNEFVVTLPELLKDNGGYFTYGLNKVYHNPSSNDYNAGATDDCDRIYSWNRMINFAETGAAQDALANYNYLNLFSFGAIPDELETELRDYKLADTVNVFLQEYANGTANTCSRPFFMAVGFKQPHMERYVPRKYYPPFWQEQLEELNNAIPFNNPPDRYPPNGFIMPPQPPQGDFWDYEQYEDGSIPQNLSDKGDLKNFIDQLFSTLDELPVINDSLTNEERQELVTKAFFAHYVMNYYASVQYIDHQLGLILDQLDALPELAANTIIITVSDHGYALGEKKHFAKWTLWETVNRIPFMVNGPGIPAATIASPVSLLDVYPTVLDMTGTPYPTFPDGSDYLDGQTLLPWINDPSAAIHRPVLSYLRNQNGVASCFEQISVRTHDYHLIRYRNNNDGSFDQNYCDEDTVVLEFELYHIGEQRNIDPEEWNNLAKDPDYQPMVDYLSQFLPDSTLFQQNIPTATIVRGDVPCFYGADDPLYLNANLLDEYGMPADEGDAFSFRWTFSTGNDTLWGNSTSITMGEIDGVDFANDTTLSVYLHVFNADGEWVAFDMLKLYLSGNVSPSVQVDYNLIDDELIIEGVSISGNFQTLFWNFDSVHTSGYLQPSPYSLKDNGPHFFEVTLLYGNGCSLTERYDFNVDTLLIIDDISPFLLFPNPSSGVTHFRTDSEVRNVELYGLDGRQYTCSWEDLQNGLYRVSTTNLPKGNYQLVIRYDPGVRSVLWQVRDE